MYSYFLRRHDPDRFNGRRLLQPDLSPCRGTRVDVIELTDAVPGWKIRRTVTGRASSGDPPPGGGTPRLTLTPQPRLSLTFSANDTPDGPVDI